MQKRLVMLDTAVGIRDNVAGESLGGERIGLHGARPAGAIADPGALNGDTPASLPWGDGRSLPLTTTG